MAIEKDAASDGKKTGMLIIAAVVIVAAGAYIGWGYLHRPEATPSVYAINNVANNAGKNSPETAQYRKLQSEANHLGSSAADVDGNSFVASLRMSDVKPALITAQPQPVSLNTSQAVTTTNASQTGSGLPEDQKAAIKSYLKILNDRWKPGGIQVAGTFGQSNQNQGVGSQKDGTASNAFSSWSNGLPGNASATRTNTQASAGNTVTDVVIVPPNTRRPGVIDSAVDSDNLNSIVLGHIPAGFLAGASFSAQGVQLAGNGVVIHFTHMTLNGIEYQVDAYALQDDTLQSSVATDVNNRYFTRIILPAVAAGIGNVGDLYKQQNTQILATNAGTISGGTGTVSGSAVAGTIAGGIGTQAGQVMANDAARLPVKQVTIEKNQVVAIQFMKGVYESDRLNKATTSAQPTTGER